MIAALSVAVLSLYFSGRGEEEKPEAAVSVNAYKDEFIENILPAAREMKAKYGILPSLIIGQAILESDWGRSDLAKDYYNLFGVKAAEGQEKVRLETKEFENGAWKTIQADFRKYKSWRESIEDHTKLFVNGVTWDAKLYHKVLTSENYKKAAQEVQAAGYATDPTYAEKVVEVIETYNLAQYDQ